MPTRAVSAATVEESEAAREEALVRACQQGDVAASGRLVDRYWEQVFAYAYRLTRRKSDAEDLAQETFLRALQAIARYRPKGQLKSWLLRITTNLFLDARKASRAKDVALDESRLAQSAVAPEESAGRKELIQALWEALQELSREQQVVVLLRTVERLEYHDIAEVLRIKEASARWHMYEARRILRLKLGARFSLTR